MRNGRTPDAGEVIFGPLAWLTLLYEIRLRKFASGWWQHSGIVITPAGRVSVDQDGTVLTFTAEEWEVFCGGVRDGEFDGAGSSHPMSLPLPPAEPDHCDCEQAGKWGAGAGMPAGHFWHWRDAGHRNGYLAHLPAGARYEVRRIYGPQQGSHGVYDTVTHTWVHLDGQRDMSEAAAVELQRFSEAGGPVPRLTRTEHD
jgi:hypothetical protein